MSDQDILLQDRIEFLASYSETMFKEELFNLGIENVKTIKTFFKGQIHLPLMDGPYIKWVIYKCIKLFCFSSEFDKTW